MFRAQTIRWITSTSTPPCSQVSLDVEIEIRGMCSERRRFDGSLPHPRRRACRWPVSEGHADDLGSSATTDGIQFVTTTGQEAASRLVDCTFWSLP